MDYPESFASSRPTRDKIVEYYIIFPPQKSIGKMNFLLAPSQGYVLTK
jgi:hypothetical protein